MTGIDESSFIQNLLPKEKVAFLKMLELLDTKLLLILKEELKQGNKILRVHNSLSDEAMLVNLAYPFKRNYETDGLQFSSSNDPHDGGGYYSTTNYTLTAPLKR